MSAYQKITEDSVAKFKSDVVSACPSLVTLKDKAIVRALPNEIFEDVLREVFGGDTTLARNVMYNRFDKLEMNTPAQEVEDIRTMADGAAMIAETLEQQHPFLLISDIDNDGSLAQAMAMEMRRITDQEISVQPRDYDPGNHGFSIAQINSWLKNDGISATEPFLVMVSDLGTNQRDTQAQFLENYPNAKLVIADHHKADIDMVVETSYPEVNPRTVLVSPFVRGSIRLAIKDGGGVSGGYLTYCLFKNALQTLRARQVLEFSDVEFENRVSPMMAMGKAANLLDNVSCDLRLKPLNEKEITKALDIASITGNGRSVGKWLDAGQDDAIRRLSSRIGRVGVDEFLKFRQEILAQNHMAMALCDVLPDILDPDPKVDIQLKITKTLASHSMQESAEINYIERLRPYMFNFQYENQFESKYKDIWLSLSSRCLREVGKLEKEVIRKLRSHQLVTEISEDFVVISRAATEAVGSVFTTRQLARAYQSRVKPLNLSVARVLPNQVVMSYRSELSISDVLHEVKSAMPNFEMTIRGHDKVGGLTLGIPDNVDPYQALSMFAQLTNAQAKEILSNKTLPKAFEVKPIHLPIVREMLEKMRVHIESAAAPLMVLKVSPNMTFEDKYSLEKQTVAQLVDGQEWESTVEPLDFSMSSSLIIPNQALKAVANDDFSGALGIKLMANGSYIASEVITGSQMQRIELAQLKTPLEKEREMLAKEYEKRFMHLETPSVNVPRAAAIEALKFTTDGAKVYENTEAILLGVLDELSADSYVVLDVEADGAGDAQCFNAGLAVFRRKEGSGKTISAAMFERAAKEKPEDLKNFRRLPTGEYQVNERIELSLTSQIIGQDGASPIRISIKSQNLTNMDQDMVDKLGVTAEEAEKRLLRVLDDAGKFVIQAHNLPYDNNIMRVNFPQIFERMQASIHLDTAPLAKNNRLAYTNVLVNEIDGEEYFNAEHPGYNLSTLLQYGGDFDYPSIKGETVLQARGDDIQTLDLKTYVTTHLSVSRGELSASLLSNLKEMKSPKYGIEKLLRMATIHDLISQQPLKTVNKIPFEGFGQATFPDELWDHFQENYAYDLTPKQNVLKFSVLPEVQEMLNQSFTVGELSDVDEGLVQARGVGKGSMLDPNKKKKSKKDQAAHDDAVRTFNIEDVLYANAIKFVNANPENAERFARSWVYELVLENHELSTKVAPQGFYQGVSDMTGVSVEMVKTIYDEVYKYKQHRDIKTYRVHETHNNVGLEGDVFQEVNVFLHMLTNKARNPYVLGKHALAHGLNPVAPMVEAMKNQAAESTLRQVIRDAQKEILDDDVINSYSAKQLDNFDDSGISAANNRDGVAKIKCRTLSTNEASVHIELPKFEAKRYRMMPTEERQELEENVELAVTAILLSNSMGNKKLDATGKTILERAVCDPNILTTMRDVKTYFEELKPTGRESQIKKLMKSGVDAILGKSPLKMSINKELSPEDLDIVAKALTKGMATLLEQQGFDSYITPDDLEETLEGSKAEFLAFEHLREHGEKLAEIDGYEPLSASAKRELTKTKTALDGVLEAHANACPDLANRILNKKTDPLAFMLKSPLVVSIMKNDLPRPEIDVTPEQDVNNGLKR